MFLVVAVLEQERQRIEQLTAGWDDPTQVDWGAEAARNGSESADAPETVPSGPLLKCTALYSYTVIDFLSGFTPLFDSIVYMFGLGTKSGRIDDC